MKGLQSGISIAMLASMAKATLISGESGVDGGQGASLPITNGFSSTANEEHSDDHSVDVDAKKKFVDEHAHHGHHWRREEINQKGNGNDNEHYYDPHINVKSNTVNESHKGDHSVHVDKNLGAVKGATHSRPHHHGRSEPDLISGESGIDTSNSASLPVTNGFSSTVNEAHSDDHSSKINKDKTVVDEDKHHHPHGHHWVRDDKDLISGESGIDTGNSASLPITNGFSSTVNEAHSDDHSADINKDKTVVDKEHPEHAKHPEHHHWVRGSDDLIKGESGIDTGNSASLPITNEFSSSYNEASKDNHAVDVNKDDTAVVEPEHPEKHHWPHHHPRGEREEPTLINGESGIDTGNSASLPITNGFSSNYNEATEDNHAVDFNKDDTAVVEPGHPEKHYRPHHHVRGEREEPTLINGESGIDTGNSASLPITNVFSSQENEASKDDHSVDVDKKKSVFDDAHHGHPDQPDHPKFPHPHVPRDLISGESGIDTGNEAVIPITNAFSSTDNESYDDDHSADVNVKHTDVTKQAHPEHHKLPHPHGPRDLISGESGIDTGNEAVIPITNVFSSTDNESYNDNHSADVNVKDTDVTRPEHRPHHHHERDLIKGESGIDTGNSASLPFTNVGSNEVNEVSEDDHSADVKDKDTLVKTPSHHHPHPHWPRDLIKGESGIDTGNSASLPITNSIGSQVNEASKDDHSVDVDSKNTAIKYKPEPKPVPVPVPVHHPHGHWPRDLIKGESGIDTGNSASLPITNVYASQENEASKDDHSVDTDVKDTLVEKPKPEPKPVPVPVQAHQAKPHPYPHHPRDLIKGESGIDTGNSATLPITNAFSSQYNEASKDDHSVDTDTKDTVVKEKPDPKPVPVPVPVHGHPHPHHPRDLIKGESGIDTGNSATIPITNAFSSEYNEASKDDHSVDADIKDTAVKGVPVHHARPDHHHARDLIKGESGIDTGNSASLPITNGFSSQENEVHKDDHSVDADIKDTAIDRPEHEHFRGHPHLPRDLIKGESGIDTGNSATIPITNVFSSQYNEADEDDHSVDVDSKKTHVDEPHRHHHRADGSLIQGESGIDTGNSAILPVTNVYGQATNEAYSDDHSVSANVKDTDVDAHHEPTEPHDSHDSHDSSKPHDVGVDPIAHSGEDDSAKDVDSSSSCASPVVHEIVHTVTRTLSGGPSRNTGLPEHGGHGAPVFNEPFTGAADAVAQSTPAYNAPEVAAGAAESTPFYNAPAQPTGPSIESVPMYNAPAESTPAAAPSNPMYNGAASIADPTGVSALYNSDPSEPEHVPDVAASSAAQQPVAMISNVAMDPAPTAPFPGNLDSIASTITIQEASTFHMIPVYVPAPTEAFRGAAAASSLGVPTPKPSGSVASEPSFRYDLPGPSSTPTPSTNSIMFTGAGAQVAPAHGFFPIVTGLVALLALIL
ncbi:hypothetical protein ASPTUDRAFT_127407 [Aspergillus tubingensis CBS 134.48]|uniref:GPI anchored protein n=1 Tax=Aspergillus tubingensis (strain CBS 134.48) TaxID=767770 RepID=A0A1L9MVE7_ASPTC|nr:hypothetical protein ASPTUDRAFT_127407 [Aspergillus tubingensis CBS 134.48]